LVPGGLTVLVHVIERDPVGNALVAQGSYQPIDHRGTVVIGDGHMKVVVGAFCLQIFDQGRGAGKAANVVDQPDSVIDRGQVLAARFRTEVFWGGPGGSAVGPGPRHQISATSLRWASLSPSMYRCVVWIDRWPARSCTSRNDP